MAADVPDANPLVWRVGQGLGLAATLALIATLVYRPTTALALWNIAIPGVMVSLFITPHVWRNVCPVATLNLLSNGWIARRVPTPATIWLAGSLGIVLLVVLVPARRFLFNTNGLSLALLIGLIAIVAFALGAVFDAKAGFCNTLCPLLPVERLFGQRPLIDSSNPRCPACSGCSARGCIDLAPSRSVGQTLGRHRRSHRWMTTPYGMFALAYPGLVVGYYLQVDGRPATAPAVYLAVLIWLIVSYLTGALLVRAFRLTSAQAVPALAAAAGALYFWFVSPVVGAAIGADEVTLLLRIATLALVTFWYLRTLWQPATERAAGSRV